MFWSNPVVSGRGERDDLQKQRETSESETPQASRKEREDLKEEYFGNHR